MPTRVNAEPTVVVEDDLEIIPDPQPEGERRIPRWLAIPAAPWLWFVIRGIHPLLDLVAIALPVLVMAGLLISVALVFGRHPLRWSVTAASLVLFFVVAVFGPWRPVDAAAPVEEQSFRIASLNLGLYWFSNNDAGFYVEREQPDIVIGAELTESHDAEFKERYEFSVGDIIPLDRQRQNEEQAVAEGTNYRRFGLPSIGVYSNIPFEVLDDPIADRFDGGLPGFRLRLDTDGGPVVLYALHIPRPTPGVGPYRLSPSEQSELIDLLVESIENENDPVVVMGDLNVVDRSSGYRSLTGVLNDGMRQSGWAVPTADRGLPFGLLLARIDHLLVHDSLCVADGASEDTRFADHRPLVANVGPCAEE